MTVGMFEATPACSKRLPIVGWFACNTEARPSEELFIYKALELSI